MSHGDDDASTSIGNADEVRAVFDALPVLLVALRAPDFRVAAANAAYRAWMGRQWLVGLSVAELWPEMLGQQVIEMIQEAFESGEPYHRRDWRVQLRPESAPDSMTERYVDFSVFPWRDVDGSALGVLVHAIDVSERVAARRAAEERAATAEQRYAHARDHLLLLQRELLPDGLPLLPGARIAASYLLADTDFAAGGDWFDAVPLPDGRIGLVVGDVVGHGLTASATMGQLRVLLEEQLLEGNDVIAALRAIDRVARRRPQAHAATVCIAVLDTATGEIQYCTAGHPPPLVLSPDGTARYLPPSGAGPLGTGATFEIRSDRLTEDDVVLLYTDGILERPGRDHAAGTVELARTAGDAMADHIVRNSGLTTVQRVTDQVVEILVRVTGHRDDLTLLAAQRVRPAAPFRWQAPADDVAIREGHVAFARWLTGLDAGAENVRALQLAVCELITNAVKHAYLRRSDPGPVRLAAELAMDGVLTVDVRDEGQWRETQPVPSERTGGLGLVLAEAMVDDLRLATDATGTQATLRHRLRVPTRMLNAEEVSPAGPASEAAPELLLILEQPDEGGPRIRLDGPVTAVTVANLTTELQRRTRSGTRRLTVDLTGVSLLTSAGIGVLTRAQARGQAHGQPLRLHAVTGSPADQILTLVAVPHTTGFEE
ncbi:SpoIIE family protein phosphatase [Cryptosporangium sp. NPDC048952]|uniref:SpoIIE family protein phosphatase n=1 Tax=Cryptosporangium sp. NPDC048952 TaxID=3363961 RepID=UPI0037196DD8